MEFSPYLENESLNAARNTLDLVRRLRERTPVEPGPGLVNARSIAPFDCTPAPDNDEAA